MNSRQKDILHEIRNKLARIAAGLDVGGLDLDDYASLLGRAHLASIDAHSCNDKIEHVMAIDIDSEPDKPSCDDQQQFLLNMAFKHLNENHADELTSSMAYAMQAEILQLNEALDIETRRTATLDNLCRLNDVANAAGCPTCEDAIEADSERINRDRKKWARMGIGRRQF